MRSLGGYITNSYFFLNILLTLAILDFFYKVAFPSFASIRPATLRLPSLGKLLRRTRCRPTPWPLLWLKPCHHVPAPPVVGEPLSIAASHTLLGCLWRSQAEDVATVWLPIPSLAGYGGAKPWLQPSVGAQQASGTRQGGQGRARRG